ncbi:nucleotidyltransferase domain-containing protein [Flavobacterium sp.]|uniref:nucleotidyltransferase family protein n=1 Tax=Flavobacterium sp. TaxID=239 RepID=UPI002617877A|nr:nucleotidyltransferase domain-containing protein [Flavobacterium sp.]
MVEEIPFIIVMDKEIENKLPEIRALFEKYGAKSAYLFGSSAKGTNNANSDVDFLYSFPNELDVETYFNSYFKLVTDLEILLKKKIDLTAEKTLKNPFLIESINESKIRLI